MNENLLFVTLVVCVIAESLAGAISAGHKHMDPLGVIIVAFATSLGGGTLRDLTLANFPLLWVNNPILIWIVISSVTFVIFIRRYVKHLLGLFLILDAIGLTGLTIVGLEKALSLGHGYTISIISGLLTGVFGGVLRDLLCGEVPWVFRKELYATISITASGIYIYLSNYTSIGFILTYAITLIGGTLLRIFAIKYKINLPTFYLHHHSKSINPE